jgi:hypothetical protein
VARDFANMQSGGEVLRSFVLLKHFFWLGTTYTNFWLDTTYTNVVGATTFWPPIVKKAVFTN